MKPVRSILVSALLLALAPVALSSARAQDEPAAEVAVAAPTPSGGDVAATSAAGRSSYDVRSDLGTLLRQSPSELATILALDPTLLSNDAFLAGYPDLARFIAQNPEVRRNPRFYLADFEVREGALHDMLEPLLIFFTFAIVATAIAWLIRTLIEQRRWSRLSRTQTEVHTKILERFGSSEALLEYMRTPAGSKFLESAPIPLRAEPPAPNAPIGRALLSIQAGVIVAAGAIGMLLVSGRLDRESAEGFFALGMIALCIGGGFILSAVVSLLLSRRLGLWQAPAAAADDDTAATAR